MFVLLWTQTFQVSEDYTYVYMYVAFTQYDQLSDAIFKIFLIIVICDFCFFLKTLLANKNQFIKNALIWL